MLNEEGLEAAARAYMEGTTHYDSVVSLDRLRAAITAYLSTVEKPVGEWAIDNSTPSPILTYENCSVIQDEQAYYVLGLVRNAAFTPPASATKGE